MRNAVLAFKNFGDRNKESVAELFVALLAKLSSIEKLWKLGLCASIFEGSWISKTWGSKVGNMSIEDFLDRSQNFARSVGKFEMTKIYDCLRGSLELLSHSMKGQIDLAALRSVLFGSISFDTQSNKAAMIINQRLPIQSVQPIVDVIGHGNHAKRRKQTFSESAQADVATINHADANTTMTLKRKLPSYEPLYPLAHAVAPSNHPGSNSMYNLEQKHPTIEFSQRHIKMISPKRACYAKPAAAASSFGSHQNHSTIYLPSPVIYPTLLNVPPQPIGLVGHPHISFDGSGHPSYRDSKRPIYAPMGHRPHHDHLIYPAHHHPTAPVPAYGSQGPQYFQNPLHRDGTGNPQYLVPSNWFG